MADFYEDMQRMATELLAPSSEGGFGQGSVVLTYQALGQPDPSRPWEPVVNPDPEIQELRAAVTSAKKYADGQTILATDVRLVAAVPRINWRLAAGVTIKVEIDGRPPLTVIRSRGLPDAGTPAAIELIARDI